MIDKLNLERSRIILFSLDDLIPATFTFSGENDKAETFQRALQG